MQVFAGLSQERIVFGLALLLCILFAVALPGFLTADNILNLVRSVSILGILGVAMGLVVIGRGIDLSLVSLMAVSVAWTLSLIGRDMPLAEALAIGLVFSLFIGAVNGWLVGYVEVPAIFATLAMGTLVYGFGRYFLFDLDVVYMPDSALQILWLGQGKLFGIPVPIFVFAVVCLVGYLFLRYARSGRYLRAIGDNLLAARVAGVPARPIIVLQYVLSSLIGYIAGIVTAGSVASMNTRLAISTYVYDVILVVVLGGIGLSGGKGNIRNVIVGTLLIGVLLNGMTIMDIQYTVQNVIKGIILLTAIMIDTILNPRDEQTAQQGDI
ncbi:MAG: ABC transporter permease [Rhizobiales bacterium]|nr:ABC transporter permease [Hyphomicrobiales bacterium]